MKCPTCKKKIEIKDNPFRPFCSERCKLIDLGKWLNGRYVIKGDDDEEEEENKESTGKRHQGKKKS